LEHLGFDRKKSRDDTTTVFGQNIMTYKFLLTNLRTFSPNFDVMSTFQSVPVLKHN